EAIPDDVLTRRSFVLIGNVEARWAAALARRSGRRHYMAGAPSGAVTVHEEAAPYAVDARAAVVLTEAQSLIARGRVAAAGRAAGRAMVLAANASRARADAVVIRARTLRWACRPADAA